MGKGVIDERSPDYLGTAALSANDFVHRAVDAADLVINVGHDVIEKPPFIMKASGFDVIHVNFFVAIVDEVYFPQYEVVGDIGKSVSEFERLLEPQPHWDFFPFHAAREALERHIEAQAGDDRYPVAPQWLVRTIREIMPPDGIVSLDNDVYKIWFPRNYRAHEPYTLLLDNALAAMGAGLSVAMAAKLLRPSRRVLAVCGDGGCMMNSQELETAMRLKLDLVVLILNDDTLGMIKWKQAGLGLPDFGLDFGNPDFSAFATSFGARGHRLERSEDLAGLVEECFAAGGLHVIEVPIDYSRNHRELNVELPELAKRV
jgi:acetolactate synthase-1/2/3 large subunit